MRMELIGTQDQEKDTMDTSQITPGIKSSNVFRVTPDLFMAHAGQFLYMMRDYFKRSTDKSSDPESSFRMIKERLALDPGFMMLAHMKHGLPVGFLAGDVLQDKARIIMGYLPPDIKNKLRDAIINDALSMFDDWAVEQKAKCEVFYTYRSPGAHKFMLNRGWIHDMSIYKKEL